MTTSLEKTSYRSFFTRTRPICSSTQHYESNNQPPTTTSSSPQSGSVVCLVLSLSLTISHSHFLPSPIVVLTLLSGMRSRHCAFGTHGRLHPTLLFPFFYFIYFFLCFFLSFLRKRKKKKKKKTKNEPLPKQRQGELSTVANISAHEIETKREGVVKTPKEPPKKKMKNVAVSKKLPVGSRLRVPQSLRRRI